MGDWVVVLERQWREVREAAPSALVRVDMSDVVFIDADVSSCSDGWRRAESN